ncbi:MZB10.14 protein [Medicago truncatula]|uniref:MZB10.14 protein n=1 Tax=Medicago truncatula TaxID=3880 RepID=A0A072U0C9_MEDTR|nr:MZB10.14 protein [Medicago truncatula]
MATFLRNFNCFAPCNEVSVKILVDEVRNKVLFVQAGKDFVDVLLSFLTLPLGTIARLVSQESNMENVCVGSLSLLYQSVANLDKDNFRSAFEKELLVRPINSMEEYCKYLKLNIDDTEKLRFFNCSSNQKCINVPKKRNCHCCEKKRTNLCAVKKPAKNGFVPVTATFLISDDLNVKPDNSQISRNSVSLLKYLGCENMDSIKIVTVDVTRKEILDLVKCSLLSATPLTDVFLSKKLFLEKPRPVNVLDLDFGSMGAHLVKGTIEVKAMVRKSNKKILYALGEEDFADLLLNFLTFPLGGVENMLNGNSGLDNIDNLFKSMVDLDPERYFRSKSDLLSKQVKSNFDGKQIIKSPSTYMVTDDLVITPGSSTDAISFLTKMRIPLSDLQERMISIGNKEAHSLLKASLISSSALTNGLGPFLSTNDKKMLN